MQQRFAVTVQIEHIIGIDSQLKQRQFERGRLSRRLLLRQHGPQGLSNAVYIHRRIGAQTAAQPRYRNRRQISKAAVEVAGTLEIEPPQQPAVQMLSQSDGIGDRHHHNLTDQPAFRLGLFQSLQQMVRH